jgi:hypothetical protein
MLGLENLQASYGPDGNVPQNVTAKGIENSWHHPRHIKVTLFQQAMTTLFWDTVMGL